MMLTLGYGGAKKRRKVDEQQEEEGEGVTVFREEMATDGDAPRDDIEVERQTADVGDDVSVEVDPAISEVRIKEEEKEIVEDEEEIVDFTLLSEDELGFAEEDEPMEQLTKSMNDSAVCDVCNKTFNGPIGLKRHIGHMHKDGKLHTTKKLQKAKAQNLVDQQIEGMQRKLPPFICSICDAEFQGNIVLRSHIARDHPQQKNLEEIGAESMERESRGAKKFHCKFCSHTSDTKQGLKYHKIKQHPKANDDFSNLIACNICEQSFKGPHGLKVHTKKSHKTENENADELKFGNTNDMFSPGMDTSQNIDGNLPIKAEQMDFTNISTDDAAKMETDNKNEVENEHINNITDVKTEDILDFTLLSEEELSISAGDEPMEEISNELDTSNMCAICDKNFTGTNGLKRHMGMKHKQDTFPKAPKMHKTKQKLKFAWATLAPHCA